MYYRDAIACIICYDVTRDDSFNSVEYWVNEMKTKNNIDGFVFGLAGNKCDCPEEQWEVKNEYAKEKIEALGLGDKLIF